MTQLTIRYEGSLRCRVARAAGGPAPGPDFAAQQGTPAARPEPDRTGLAVSAAGAGGRAADEFSPTELVAAGLATCVLSIIAVAAETKGTDLTGMTATVSSSMTTGTSRRFERIAVEVRIPHEPSERDRVALERAAHLCPVHRSFSHDVELPITFLWGRGAPGGR